MPPEPRPSKPIHPPALSAPPPAPLLPASAAVLHPPMLPLSAMLLGGLWAGKAAAPMVGLLLGWLRAGGGVLVKGLAAAVPPAGLLLGGGLGLQWGLGGGGLEGAGVVMGSLVLARGAQLW